MTSLLLPSLNWSHRASILSKGTASGDVMPVSSGNFLSAALAFVDVTLVETNMKTSVQRGTQIKSDPMLHGIHSPPPLLVCYIGILTPPTPSSLVLYVGIQLYPFI